MTVQDAWWELESNAEDAGVAITDEAASATAENFVAQSGVTMAGVNEDPDTGDSLGSVWNIHGNAEMTN